MALPRSGVVRNHVASRLVLLGGPNHVKGKLMPRIAIIGAESQRGPSWRGRRRWGLSRMCSRGARAPLAKVQYRVAGLSMPSACTFCEIVYEQPSGLAANEKSALAKLVLRALDALGLYAARRRSRYSACPTEA